MKMIRFENVCDSIREAMFRFYMEQTCFDRDVCVEKIEKLVDRTFDAMSEIPNTNLTVGNIPRFAVMADEYTEEILPMYIKNSDMLYTEAVQLASFVTDGYSSDKPVGAYTARGYDIVYDFTSGKVKLLYFVMTDCNDMLTLYRTETDYIEKFSCYKFTEILYSQMTEMLKNSIFVPTLNVFMEVC